MCGKRAGFPTPAQGCPWGTDILRPCQLSEPLSGSHSSRTILWGSGSWRQRPGRGEKRNGQRNWRNLGRADGGHVLYTLNSPLRKGSFCIPVGPLNQNWSSGVSAWHSRYSGKKGLCCRGCPPNRIFIGSLIVTTLRCPGMCPDSARCLEGRGENCPMLRTVG